MRARMRSIAFGLAVLVVAAAPVAARAEPSTNETLFGVRTGVYTEAEAAFVGAEVVTPIAPEWYFNPNLEYAFAGGDEVLSVNGDFHYDFILDRPFFVWAGAGPAVIVREDAFGERQSDLGLNLIGGMGWKKPKVEPYVQAKVAVSEDTEAVLAFGARF